LKTINNEEESAELIQTEGTESASEEAKNELK
jgi:hypothetical protein